MQIRIIEDSDEAEYESLVLRSTMGSMYQSFRFRRLLEHMLKDVRLQYLGAFENGSLQGVLPCVIKLNKGLGNVANSLPFLGSHGGCVIDKDLDHSRQSTVRRELLARFSTLINERSCVSSTIITSPFDSESESYERLSPQFVDNRICQVLDLPSSADGLLARFRKNCRNAVHSAERKGLRVAWGVDEPLFEKLVSGHKETMSRVGASSRPNEFFAGVRRFFRPDKDFRIYSATKEEEVAGLLLVIYYKDIVEYCVPVAFAAHRSLSPMNLIVYEVAKDAIARGYRYFSFGGTRKDQHLLYSFKKSFGAQDRTYHYYTTTNFSSSTLAKLGERQILDQFPWFYVIPFDALGNQGHKSSSKGENSQAKRS